MLIVLQVQQCIRNCTPEPLEDFITYFKDTPVPNEKLNCANRLVLLTVDIPSLRRTERHLLDCSRYTRDPKLVTELMQAAEAIDVDLVRWSDTVPNEWHYLSTPITDETKKDVYPRSIDLYDDDLVANNWNSWRMNRLHLLTIIVKCASILSTLRSDSNTEREDFQAIDTIQELVNGICASVPFHLGHIIDDKYRSRSLYPHAFGSALRPSPTGALGVFMLKEPLNVASTMSCIPESQRRWMREYQAL